MSYLPKDVIDISNCKYHTKFEKSEKKQADFCQQLYKAIVHPLQRNTYSNFVSDKRAYIWITDRDISAY